MRRQLGLVSEIYVGDEVNKTPDTYIGSSGVLDAA